MKDQQRQPPQAMDGQGGRSHGWRQPPPAIRIRKDAEVEPSFHYSREQRLGRPDAPRPRIQQKGPVRRFFLRGRFLPLPVLIVVIGIVLGTRILSRDASQGHLAGWDAVLQTEQDSGALLAFVTFTPRPRPGEEVARGLVEVSFQVPETGASAVATGALAEGRTDVRVRLPARESAGKLEAEVRIGEIIARLEAGVPRAVGTP